MGTEKLINIIIGVVGLSITIYGVFQFSKLKERIKTLEEMNTKLLELLKDK